MVQLTPIEQEMQASQFNAAMARGDTTEVERLNPLFTLYKGGWAMYKLPFLIVFD